MLGWQSADVSACGEVGGVAVASEVERCGQVRFDLVELCAGSAEPLFGDHSCAAGGPDRVLAAAGGKGFQRVVARERVSLIIPRPDRIQLTAIP
jgi:hypothetical protein